MSSLAELSGIGASGTTFGSRNQKGGQFDFDDGGTYCGGWEDGKAHGNGVCTGPKGEGEYKGSWNFGFEVSGVYIWPSGSYYQGMWQNGRRHGLGNEARSKWIYCGEWTQGYKGRYGVRLSTVSAAKYEGTWANGLQDGYGTETYADRGTYQGQWLRGMRHGYGVRMSASFGQAVRTNQESNMNSQCEEGHNLSQSQMMKHRSNPDCRKSAYRDDYDDDDEFSRGRAASECGEVSVGFLNENHSGFVLRERSDEVMKPRRRRRSSLVEKSGVKSLIHGIKLRRGQSAGDLEKQSKISDDVSPMLQNSTSSTTSWLSSESGYSGGARINGNTSRGGGVMSCGSNNSFELENDILDPSVTEMYMGEWKNDKRCGFGISERSDGLKYEGEWYNNKKYGYGVTTKIDGSREEGKYKNNVLVRSNQKRHLFLIRTAKLQERIEAATNSAQRCAKLSLQKTDIAISRTSTARAKAEQADESAEIARHNAELAVRAASIWSKQQQCDNESLNYELSEVPEIKLNSVCPTPTGAAATDSIFTDHIFKNGHAHQMVDDTYNLPEESSCHKGLSPSVITIPFQGLLEDKASPYLESPLIDAPYKNQETRKDSVFLNNMNYISNREVNSKEASPTNVADFDKDPEQIFADCRRKSLINSGSKSFNLSNNTILTPELEHFKNSGVYEDKSRERNNYISSKNNEFDRRKKKMNKIPHCESDCLSDKVVVQQLQKQLDSMVDSIGSHNKLNAAKLEPPLQHSKEKLAQPVFDDTQLQMKSQRRSRSLHRGSVGQHRGSKSTGSLKKQIVNDHFDHYRHSSTSRTGSLAASRTTSRDASVDRYGGGRNISRNSLAHHLTRGVTPVSSDGRSSASIFKSSIMGESAIDDDGGGIRHRADQLKKDEFLSQDLPRDPGTPLPKRTESLYFDEPIQKQQNTRNFGGIGGIQRKNSLPDVQILEPVMETQGSIPMTREEISTLSSSRRRHLRWELEQIEMYRRNPLLYLINPELVNWMSQQQLMILFVILNLLIAFLFFKLLT